MVRRLDPLQVATALEHLPGWKVCRDGTAITRRWRCPDFAQAFALVGRVAVLSEAANHHPEIEFGWGRVAVTLSTHDAGGLSVLDFDLAERINRTEETS